MTINLPPPVLDDLLTRWNEPHRHYHGPLHLEHGLEVLADLKAPELVKIAWWFHDAVHHNNSPADEQASATLARRALGSLVSSAEVDEVSRLVLLTIDHRPDQGDEWGAMICDADLHSMALPFDAYRAQVSMLRRERTDLDDQTWFDLRRTRLHQLLARDQLFHTKTGARDWEALARANLSAELTMHPPTTPPTEPQ